MAVGDEEGTLSVQAVTLGPSARSSPYSSISLDQSASLHRRHEKSMRGCLLPAYFILAVRSVGRFDPVDSGR